jgi:transposase-like protein
MSDFRWTPKQRAAAFALADGQTQAAAAAEADVTDRTLRRWLQEPEFSAEVDRLTLMIGVASRAERLRLVKRIIRERVNDHVPIKSDRDILDWLKYAQSETDGIRLDLTSLIPNEAER